MRLIKILPLIFPIAAIACGDANEKMKMASLLQQDDEFSYFACGDDKKCSESANGLISKLEFSGLPASPTNGVSFCFVEPAIKARNGYTGVFLLDTHSIVSFEFVFFGSGIGPTKDVKNGYYTLNGREIVESGAIEKTVFIWNGRHYVVKGRSMKEIK